MPNGSHGSSSTFCSDATSSDRLPRTYQSPHMSAMPHRAASISPRRTFIHTSPATRKRSRGTSSGSKSALHGGVLERVELRVDLHPSRCAAVPVLAHPVVHVLAGLEVRREAAAGARRHALLTQERAQHRREVAADPDDALVRQPHTRRSPPATSALPAPASPPRRAAPAPCRAPACTSTLYACAQKRCDQQHLHGVRERADVVRQRIHLAGELADRRERPGRRVVRKQIVQPCGDCRRLRPSPSTAVTSASSSQRRSRPATSDQRLVC